MTPEQWFGEFRQRVRAHRPSELLPVLARLAVAQGIPPYDVANMQPLLPWSIPVIAKESILWGNEHRDALVTQQALLRLGRLLQSEPAPEIDPVRVHPLMTRYSYEQFPYQESIFEEVSRSHALFIEGARDLDLEVVHDDAWTDILGAPLGQVVGATFLLQVAADENFGYFDATWLDYEDLAPIFEHWPRSVIDRVADSLSHTPTEFQAAYRQAKQVDLGLERWGYNPLSERPFVRMPDNRLLAPQPRLILRSVSPGRLYYAGMKAFGNPFARDLGHLVEHYVGRQLTLVEGADLYGEIVYEGTERRSIDWFLVLPQLIVLFEVKSARLGTVHRAGGDGLDDRISTLLNRAIGQIEGTIVEINARNPQFSAIPIDRPILGVIVTAEPFYLANTPWVRDLTEEPPVPTVVASLRDLEFLVTLPSEVLQSRLLGIARGTVPGWELRTVLEGADLDKNTILKDAWESYPWPAAISSPPE